MDNLMMNTSALPHLFKLQKTLARVLLQGNFENAAVALERVISVISLRSLRIEMIKGLFFYFIGELEVQLYELENGKSGGSLEYLYGQLSRCATLKDIQSWLGKTVFPLIEERLKQSNVPEQKRKVRQLILYIRENNDPLSLQRVSDDFSLHPSQISRLFKEETGMNFIDYMTEKRMKKAAGWLEQTQMPIKEIAERLQYSTIQSFARIFKKRMGIPPGEYRRICRL